MTINRFASKGIRFAKVWSDEDLVELNIDVCDGMSLFSNLVYLGTLDLPDVIRELELFRKAQHGGLWDLRFGKFGPEYASGAFEARFHFPEPGKIYITSRQEYGFEPFGRKTVAGECTLHLQTEPSLLDSFIDQLRKLDAGEADVAFLETL